MKNIEDEKKQIETFIDSFAETLSSANIKSIGSYYAEDGIMYPDGYRALSKKRIDASSGNFLQKKKFGIAYVVNDITIRGEFAFVECKATAISSEHNGSNMSTRITRDLFILQREENAWKIYRYLFNNAN